MSIERCEKCGKAFISQSEVERHKMYEHPVPVSPFEEKSAYDDAIKNNGNMKMEDLQKMTTNVTTRKVNSNNDITTIGGKQIKKVTLRTSGD
jgi:hypothetical protein